MRDKCNRDRMNGNITEITKLVIKVGRNRITEEKYFCEQKEETICGLDTKPPSGDRENWLSDKRG
jgi:hypothetical protein